MELRAFPYPVSDTIARVEALGFPADVTEDLTQLLRRGELPMREGSGYKEWR